MSDDRTEPHFAVLGPRKGAELTVKEYAAVERVHERTVRRWIDKDAVPHRKTPGGGIRILIATEGAST